ncbi:hypothetical protein PC129_g12315 [Phytophthora cactorum]|uniref:Uncharacterized protein n=1 Tax=Phytophthora cactorum TaxID=29920 RepID=A0A8T1HXJ0_9STRA|nr:hypothetical protein PC129_g12315 [Phytophthora cactorum]
MCVRRLRVMQFEYDASQLVELNALVHMLEVTERLEYFAVKTSGNYAQFVDSFK